MNHPAFEPAVTARRAAILIVDDAPASLGLLQDMLRGLCLGSDAARPGALKDLATPGPVHP